jgi:hypothetical protein
MIFEGVEKALEPQTFTSPKVSQNPDNSESNTTDRAILVVLHARRRYGLTRCSSDAGVYGLTKRQTLLFTPSSLPLPCIESTV